MFSSGYDIGDIPEDVFAVEAEKLVAHPFTAALDALEASDLPSSRRCPATRSAAGSSWRCAATCASPPRASARHAAGQARARLLAHRPAALRPGVGAPRTRELFLLGRNVDAQTAEAWGLVNRVAAPDDVQDVALDLAWSSRRTRRCRSAATSGSCESCSSRRAAGCGGRS
jgi:enoyl-CoA hydratase/carnithine racemase